MKPKLIQSLYRYPPAVGLSRYELDRYLRRAHCLRAAAFRRLIRGAVGGIFRGIKQARDRRRAIAELRRLDQRTLKDVGIERSQIPFIVEQLLERRKADGNTTRIYPLRTLTGSQTSDAGIEDDERCPPLAA